MGNLINFQILGEWENAIIVQKSLRTHWSLKMSQPIVSWYTQYLRFAVQILAKSKYSKTLLVFLPIYERLNLEIGIKDPNGDIFDETKNVIA